MKMISRYLFACLCLIFCVVINLAQEAENPIQVVNGLVNGKPFVGGIINGKARNLVTPQYPPQAKAANLSGIVKVEILVGLDGKVIEAKPVAGDSIFFDVVVAAALRSSFSPTFITGQPVYVSGIIVYNFTGDNLEKEREAEEVEKKIKVFHLKMLLERFADFDENRGKYGKTDVNWIKSELSEFVADFPFITDDIARFNALKPKNAETVSRLFNEISSNADYQFYGADSWQCEVGKHYAQLVAQFKKANGGKGGLKTQNLDANVIKSNLLEIQRLANSAPSEIPQTFIESLERVGVFANESDLMKYENLQNLRSAVSYR